VIAANKAGKYFALIAGQDAVIAVLEGIPSTSSNLDRMEGYRQAFDEAGFRIAVTQTANYNRAEGLIVTENILQPNPDITAIIAMNDEMALGAIEAVRSKGKKPGEDIIVTGFDASHDAQAVVLAGEMVYTVEQKPVLIGETAVEAARSYLDGASVPSVIPVDVEIFAKQQPLKNSKMRIVLQDLGDNRPGCRTSPMNGARRAVRLDGVPADALLDAVMRFFPLDNYVEKPVTLTKPRHGEAVPEIWSKFDAILRKWDSEKAYSEFRLLERTEFYEYAKGACAVVQTGTAARYACVALRKGVI
jgi:L-fucose mutarotase/ribose pyranase (RbsD/FucU family)